MAKARERTMAERVADREAAKAAKAGPTDDDRRRAGQRLRAKEARRRAEDKAARTAEKQAALAKTQASILEVVVPILEHGSALIERMDFRLNPRQSAALRRLYDGLVSEGEQVDVVMSEPVATQYDALRWLLDRIADGAGIE